MNKWQIFISCLIILVFIFETSFASNFSLFHSINKGLDNCHGHVVRNGIINFFDNIYDIETSSFIKLILLNIKCDETHVFYKQVVDLGIVWLICISGFHISWMTRIISWLSRSRPKVGKYINICFVGLYSYVLRFSYASIRILFKFVFDYVFRRYDIKRYDKLGFIGLTICLLNPACFTSYSFLLSFVICVGAYFINGLELNNKVINSLLINITAFLLTIPFVVDMNHKIALLTFVNAFAFSYFSSFIFIYFLLFSWLPFMAIIHKWIMIGSYVLIGNISFSNIYIYSQTWPSWSITIYYSVITGLSKLVYLIVYNNKI